MAELPPKYVPSEHEGRIRDRWNSSSAFGADPSRVTNGEAPPYCIVIPPPNVTARLHLGHALNNSLQDILIRSHRMMGCETLWLPGTDHAGIATQTVVERRLLEEEGKRRTDFEREAFVARVQVWKDEYEAAITDQLKRMGCSCDWDRQRFTMDPVCARAVREAFFRLFKEGLIYRGKRLVNWDPVTQTALADDEVEMKEVNGQFFYLRYPLIHTTGAAKGQPVTWSELAARGYPVPRADAYGDEDRAFVTVATTRPETYLGDTAVAINPDDPRASALDGFSVQLPLVGRIIPIVRDEYVVMPDPESDDAKARYATGFLKVTPAHDPNDWEIGQRHGLDAINVMAPDASVSDAHGWTDVGNARLFVGLSRQDARKKVVAWFKSEGLLEDAKPYRHSVGHSYRSHAAIEPYLSDQWYVRVTDDRLRGAALRAMASAQRTSKSFPAQRGVEGDGELRFSPERYAKTFEQWHENLRDWCISRQLWWGHRIPVWAGPTEALDENKDTRDFLNLHAKRAARFDDPENSRTFFCLRWEQDDDDLARALEAIGFVRDPDVLDTWFSSALWPLSTMGWPEPASETAGLLDAFNPTSVLCTAREIITLWVSRMVMFNRFFSEQDGRGEQLPFRDVFIHAMIQDGEGRKMSKSLGNGVDPLDIINSHGSDAMRFTLCKMTTQTQDVRMPVERDPATGLNTSPKFDEGRNFCTKLWNASRFAMMNLSEAAPSKLETVTFADLTLPDVWMLSRLAGAIERVNIAIAEYQFSIYAQTMYDLLWRDFCDWYLEAVKPTLRDHPGQQAVLRASLDCILRLLHPICPFVTEAIHERLREFRTARIKELPLEPADLLCRAAWPVAESGLANPDAERTFERIRGLVDTIRQTRSQTSVEPKRKIVLHADAGILRLAKQAPGVVETLAGLERLSTDPPEGGSVAFTFETTEYALSGLADAVDASTERELLAEALAKLDKDIGVLEGRLGNPGYAQKAPPQIVQQTREQLAAKQAERETLRKRFKELG